MNLSLVDSTDQDTRIPPTDAELIRRFLAGDESAFAEIIRRYQTKIFALVQSSLHNHADAEEVTQDTFVRAYHNLARFRGDSSLATWLRRIALNLARKRYWYFFRRKRHASVSLHCPIDEETGSTFSDIIADVVPDPAQESTRDEFNVLVAAALSRLAPVYHEILALRNVDNWSYNEIAEHIGINLGTVKSRIARARELLRAELAKSCPEFAEGSPLTDWFEPERQTPGLASLRLNRIDLWRAGIATWRTP